MTVQCTLTLILHHCLTQPSYYRIALYLLGFIGYAPEIYSIVNHGDIGADGDDQLYYTQIFLDTKLRVRLLHI